jgi:hypothetical protein
MNALAFLRTALPVWVAAIGLTGCALPPAATPPATPAIAVQRDANAKSVLLYISNGGGNVAVYRYWKRTLVGLLTGFKAPKGECVDAEGNVFITDSGLAKIRVYAHGGTKPIRVLEDRGYRPYSCSVDPTNGSLAVANYHGSGFDGGIAIYRHAEGKPKFYGPIDGLPNPVAVGYDNQGNLLIASLDQYTSSYEYASFALLPKGSQSFIEVKLQEISSGSPFEDVTCVQWDGQYWAIADSGQIYRYAIADDGDSTFEGIVSLSGGPGYEHAQFWIYEAPGVSQVVGTDPASNTLSYWHYPAGGVAIASITGYLNQPYGVTVSPRSATENVR